MANEDERVPEFKPDVPKSTAIVKSVSETQSLARKMSGETLPDECRFHCITCGWSKTLKFEEGEVAALGGDIKSYGGPCPECEAMTLTPYDGLMGRDIKTVYGQAKENRAEDFREGAEIVVDVVKEELAGLMAGSILQPPPEPQPDEIHDPRPPGQRPDLPDADDVDDGDLDGRSEGG